MLENLIRRTVDMPAYDVAGVERKRVNQERQEEEREKVAFWDTFQGPVRGELDSQVTNPEDNTYYQEPRKAMLQAEMNQLRAAKEEQYRNEHPITMTMAGDCQYVRRALYLDKPDDDDDDLYWQSMNADYYRWRSMP